MSNLDWDKYEIKGDNIRSKKNIPQQGILEDIGEGVMEAPGAFGNALLSIPEHAMDAAEALGREPVKPLIRGAGAFGSGALELGKGLYNLPLNIASYLGRHDVPYFKQISPLAEKLKIGDTGLEHAILGEERPEDLFYKDLSMLLPFKVASKLGTRPGLTLKKSMGTGAVVAAGQDENPVTGALLGAGAELGGRAIGKGFKTYRDLKKSSGLENQIDLLRDAAAQRFEEAKSDIAKVHPETSPEAFSRSIGGLNEKIESLQDAANIPQVDLSKINIPEDLTPEINLTEQSISNIQQNIKDILKPKIEHDVPIGEAINEGIKSRKKAIQKSYYKPVQQTLSRMKFKVTQTPELESFNKSMKDLLGENYELNPQYEKILNQYLDQVKSTKLVPGNELWDLYKDTKSQAVDAFYKSRQEGQQNRSKFQQLHGDLNQLSEKLHDLFIGNLDAHTKKLLEEGNKAWSEQVTPVYGLKLYEASKKNKGLPSANIIRETRGKDAGQKILQNIILENPEARMAAIGQRFAKNPENILGASELEQKFIQRTPEIQQLVEALESGMRSLENLRSQKPIRDEQIKAQKELYENQEKEQKKREVAQQKIDALKKEIMKKEEASKKLDKAIDENKGNKNKIEKLEEQKKLIDEDIKKKKDQLKFIAKLGLYYTGYQGLKKVTNYLMK